MPVDPGVPLVVTAGNYLLLDAEVAAAVGVELDDGLLSAWAGAREQIDQVWFVALDDAVRIERLTAATRERADRAVVL